jgi:hypothetical protein
MRPTVLVAFVDALGPSQLAWMGDSLDMAPHRGALDGILGYSCGALPTLLTGTPPARHGRMCLFAKAGQHTPLSPLKWLNLLPRVVHERGVVRRAVGRAAAAVRGFRGYFELYRIPPEVFTWTDVPEKDDLFQSGTIGGMPTFLGDARAAGLVVHAAEWRLPEERRWQATYSALAQGPDLAFVYATELDGTLHRHGNGGAEGKRAAESVRAKIGRAHDVLTRAGRDVTTIVVGDHGMADVRRHVDPRPILDGLAARAFVDATMLRVWGDASALSAARRATERHGAPGTWLGEDDLASRKAPTKGAPFGDAIFVLDEGALFVPSFLGGAVRGMHGYDLGNPSSRAALAASAADITECRALTDVAGVVRRRLGIREAIHA